MEYYKLNQRLLRPDLQSINENKENVEIKIGSIPKENVDIENQNESRVKNVSINTNDDISCTNTNILNSVDNAYESNPNLHNCTTTSVLQNNDENSSNDCKLNVITTNNFVKLLSNTDANINDGDITTNDCNSITAKNIENINVENNVVINRDIVASDINNSNLCVTKNTDSIELINDVIVESTQSKNIVKATINNSNDVNVNMRKVTTRGRSKSRTLNAVGLKRKQVSVNVSTVQPDNQSCIDVSGTRPTLRAVRSHKAPINFNKNIKVTVKPALSKKFSRMSVNEKVFIILSYFLPGSKMREIEAGKMNILESDLQFNNSNFGVLIDDRFKLEILTHFLSNDNYLAFKKFSNEEINPKYDCKVCKRKLIGKSVSCDRCICSIHLKCTNLTKVPKEDEDWFCNRCV